MTLKQSISDQRNHIFISYRSIESEFALKIAADLRNSGVAIWMDRLDGITGADDWRRAIEKGLQDAGALIAILSPEYINSKYCMRELATADELNIPIVPIMLRNIPVEKRPLEVRRLQYVEFQDWREPIIYSERLTEFLRVVHDRVSDHMGELPDTETRYLNRLIASLENRRGVLEYVDLAGTADTYRGRSVLNNELEDEFGFSELVPNTSKSHTGNKKNIGIRKAFKEYSRFVLIGDAGSSKTTTLRRLALEAARHRLKSKISPLPLLFLLPNWSNDISAQEFVKAQWLDAQLPEHVDPIALLKSGEAIVFLDGLNEIGSRSAEKAISLREWFSSTDSPKHVVVTCRKDSYLGDYVLNLPVIQVEPMTDKHISLFARNYLGDDAEKLLERILPQDRITRGDVHHLYHLAKNPYMLAALIVVFDNSENQELAVNNGRLFQKLTRALAKREAYRQSPGWNPLEEKFPEIERLLATLAFYMLRDHKGTVTTLEYATKVLDIYTLQAASSANYIDINGNHVSYYHQLMQEYFAAVHLVNSDADIPITSHTKFIGKTLADFQTSSDELVAMIVGIHDNPEPTIQNLIHKNVYTAVRAIINFDITISVNTKKLICDIFLKELEDTLNFRILTEYDELMNLLNTGQQRDEPHHVLSDREEIRIGILKKIISICKCLEWIDYPYDESILNQILRNKDLLEAQHACALALVKSGNDANKLELQSWKELQVQNLHSEEIALRKTAAHSCGIFKIQAAVTRLIELLEDNSRADNPIKYVLSRKANRWTEPWYGEDYLSVPPISVVAFRSLEQFSSKNAIDAVVNWHVQTNNRFK